MTVFDGISARLIDTDRSTVTILERDGDDPAAAAENTIVLLHADPASSVFVQELMADLPGELRVVAVTSASAADRADLDDALTALAVGEAHLVDVSAGGEPAAVRRALLEEIGYIGRPADPAPPTEAIILSSWD